jgi:hypothetical protein
MLLNNYEVAPDEIEKTFGIVVGKQFKSMQTSTGGTSGGSQAGAMTDDEYLKRYGHPRGAVANFLRGKK